MFLDAIIVFVGVAGNHHEGIERQLAPLLDHAGVNEMLLPAPDLAAIVRHSDNSREGGQEAPRRRCDWRRIGHLEW